MQQETASFFACTWYRHDDSEPFPGTADLPYSQREAAMTVMIAHTKTSDSVEVL